MDNVEVHLNFGKSYSILNIELSSKNVIADVGSKETKLKSSKFFNLVSLLPTSAMTFFDESSILRME